MTEGSKVTWVAWGPAHHHLSSQVCTEAEPRGQRGHESRGLASVVLGGFSHIQGGGWVCSQGMWAGNESCSFGAHLSFSKQGSGTSLLPAGRSFMEIENPELAETKLISICKIGNMAVSVCWWSMQSVLEAFCRKLEKAGRGFLQSFFGSDYSFIYKRSFRPSVGFQCNWEKTLSSPGLYKCAKKARLQRLLELIKQRQKSCLLWWGGGGGEHRAGAFFLPQPCFVSYFVWHL